MDCVYETYEGKDLSQLKRVTLVIPTYNRNYYLSRCLWYHAHFPFAEIIVADSSDENKREVNRQTISDIQQMFPTKITYLEYNFPAEKYGGEIYRKWGDAVMHVNTEYSLSCTDKEFLIPTTVAKSVVFLDEHEDYSIADGIYLRAESQKIIFRWQGTDITKLTCNDVVGRLKGVLDSNVPIGTQFSLQRSINHKRTYHNLEKYNLYDIRFGEIEIEVNPIIDGKVHRELNDYMSLRDIVVNKRKTGLLKVEINKSESSFTRYPFIYPNERYATYFNRLLFCFHEKCASTSIIRKVIEKNISQRYSDAGNFKNPILNNFKIAQYIWENQLPYNIKQVLSKYFGSGLVEPQLNKKYWTSEIKLILQIMKISSPYHDNDETIHNIL